MITILQINTVNNYGSVGRIAEDLGKCITSQEWGSYIAYGRYPRNSESKLIRIGTDFDFYYHVISTRLFDNHGLESKRATFNFIRQIELLKPDLIHLHNIHGYYVNYEILFNYLSFINKPVIWTLHDCWSFTGHCSHFEYVNCNKWQTICGNCLQLGRYPSTLFVDKVNRNFLLKKACFTGLRELQIITPSYWLKSKVEQSFLSKYPIKVINNGIDINIFSPQKNDSIRLKLNINKEKKIVLGCANVWNERKGIIDIIELSRIIDDNIIIILVGLTKKQIKELPDNIIGIERTESISELAQLYSLADVFINPTYEDTFPTTNLESLACGTPVITYKSGGSPEVIDEFTGRIVEKNNIHGLSKAIDEILTLDSKKIRNKCRDRAVNYFDKNIMFSEYVNLYKSTINFE